MDDRKGERISRPIRDARRATRDAPPAPHAVSWTTLTLTLAFRALRDPSLAADLLRVAWRFRSRGWYKRFPFLPLADRTYVQWRMHTAYGDYDAVPPVDDVIRYARWAVRDK